MNFLKETYKWTVPAIVLLIICADIEYGWVLFPSVSNKIGIATNEIIKALSYSYIAAAIFHLIVIYIPTKQRTKKMSRIIASQLHTIKELLRQSKEVACPFNLKQNISRDEYVDIFDKTNLYDCWIDKNKSKITKLNELKVSINDHIDSLLAIREYLNDAQFNWLTYLKNSIFLSHEIYPRDEKRPDLRDNQIEIGTSLYDLNERKI